MIEPFYADETLTVFEGDCRAVLRQMPDASVHCVMTSPPYWGLRDYGIPPVAWGGDPDHEHVWGEPERTTFANNVPGPTNRGKNPLARDIPKVAGQWCNCGAWCGQLGLEPTPTLYIAHLVEVFREVRRVLHPEGLAWLNLGDSYAADRSGTEMPAETMAGGVGGHGDDASKRGRKAGGGLPHRQAKAFGLKHKDLVGIPWMAAFALRDDGWWLRRDVVWSKPNPMPESAEDRPASSHEYVFMLSRSERYFYDRIAVLEADVAGHSSGNGFVRPERLSGNLANGREEEWEPGSGRNRRSVWNVATRPYKGAHFAVFPPALVDVPVKASTSSFGACPECGCQWRRLSLPSVEYAERLGSDRVRGDEYSAELDMAEGRLQGRGESGMGNGRSVPFRDDETLGWRPGCGHGWGGDPDDLDLIASPIARGDATKKGTARRGLDRERLPGGGRRIITRFEQRAYAKQLKAWDGDRQMNALNDIAEWLDRLDDLLEWRAQPVAGEHPAEDAWRHYCRVDRKGARAIPARLFASWEARGWLTPVEPPDYSGALAPVQPVVMDIFAGSGTVGMVAASLGRRAILIDVNGDYLLQQMKRNVQTGLGLGL